MTTNCMYCSGTYVEEVVEATKTNPAICWCSDCMRPFNGDGTPFLTAKEEQLIIDVLTYAWEHERQRDLKERGLDGSE